MTCKRGTALALLLAVQAPAFAHALDEYLQGTIITIDADGVRASMRLVPGVAVLPEVLAVIDSDSDQVISAREQRTYANQVLADISLRFNGKPVAPELIGYDFPTIERMQHGLGEIHIEYAADLPQVADGSSLALENRHQSRISAWLVNAAIAPGANVQVTAQVRNHDQSSYRVDYVHAPGHALQMSVAAQTAWLAGIALAMGLIAWQRGLIAAAHR